MHISGCIQGNALSDVLIVLIVQRIKVISINIFGDVHGILKKIIMYNQVSKLEPKFFVVTF